MSSLYSLCSLSFSLYLSAGASVISAARVRRRVDGSAAKAANKSADRSETGYDVDSAADGDADDDDDADADEDAEAEAEAAAATQ